jgi:4-hydroxybenzoate polyprenyltransferase
MRPLPYRLLAWGNERFGPAPILLYFLLYLAGILYARAIAGDRNPSVSTLDVVAFSAVFGYVLLVRVLDEHKDYDKDCINFPDRVLQRGLVTLDQLKVIGVLTLVPQIVVSMLVDGGVGPATLAWLVLFGWTTLMLKEFFAREWLEPKLVLYAITHIVAGPLALIWIALIGADSKHLPASVGWLALLAFLVGATLEVGRKLHAPEDERETVASYTKSFGGPADQSPLPQLVWSYREEAAPVPRSPADWQASTAASVALAKALRRAGFRFVGPTTVYAAMQACGVVNDHLATCPARPAAEQAIAAAQLPA